MQPMAGWLGAAVQLDCNGAQICIGICTAAQPWTINSEIIGEPGSSSCGKQQGITRYGHSHD
jgi:hypothetical protein